jgi:sec-independent protein translocase protein TatA
MNVFGIGLPEMALIMVLALLVFGPKKLPEIGRSLGKALRGFQEASKEFESEFKREAERLNQTLTDQPMEAKLETPTHKQSSPPQLTQAPKSAVEPTTASPQGETLTSNPISDSASVVNDPQS